MSRLLPYAIGSLGVVLVAAGWVAVQVAWKRVFPGKCNEPDALASRGACLGCSHGNSGGGSDEECR